MPHYKYLINNTLSNTPSNHRTLLLQQVCGYDTTEKILKYTSTLISK
jgi:hypothetical protein